jgi:hypothetical protein
MFYIITPLSQNETSIEVYNKLENALHSFHIYQKLDPFGQQYIIEGKLIYHNDHKLEIPTD